MYMQIHGGCGSKQRTCIGSSQTEFQIWKGKVHTVSHSPIKKLLAMYTIYKAKPSLTKIFSLLY